jgi:hypothetical protein
MTRPESSVFAPVRSMGNIFLVSGLTPAADCSVMYTNLKIRAVVTIYLSPQSSSVLLGLFKCHIPRISLILFLRVLDLSFCFGFIHQRTFCETVHHLIPVTRILS